MKKILSVFIIFILMLSINPINISAAGINKKYLTINLSETFQLKVSGNNKVTWKSNNIKIAKVSIKGIVSPVAPGTTTIIGKIGSISYECLVTVTSSNTDYLVCDNDKVKIVYKGTSLNRLCFEFTNKTDNYYFIRTKPFDIDGFVYKHYLVDFTLKGKKTSYVNFKPGLNTIDEPGIVNDAFKCISGTFVLCLMKDSKEVEKIEYKIFIEDLK